MWLKTDEIAKNAKAGQFISVYCKDGSRMLPRPISICEIDKKRWSIEDCLPCCGQGNRRVFGYESRNDLRYLRTVRKRFSEKIPKSNPDRRRYRNSANVRISQKLECEKQIVLGYRDELFLTEEFEKAGEIYLATEDGSMGTKGTVLDAIRVNELKADIIYACGPTPMLKAVKEYAKEAGIECWISMEERMACGIGACLACVCKSRHKDSHTNVHNKRICKEGPVFLAEEVEL